MEAGPTTKERSVSQSQAISVSPGVHNIHTVITWHRLSTLNSEEGTTSAGTLEGKWRALGVSLWTLMLEWMSVTFSPAVSRTSQPYDLQGGQRNNWFEILMYLSNVCFPFPPRASRENEKGDTVHLDPQHSHPSYYRLLILLDLHVPQQTKGVCWHPYSPTTHCLTESRSGAAPTYSTQASGNIQSF